MASRVMSGYLLDTDILSAHLRGHSRVTQAAFAAVGQLHSSVISLAELCAWLDRRTTPKVLQLGLSQLIPDLTWHPVSMEIARRAGMLRAESYDRGRALPFADVLIAATALQHGLTVVTHNQRHFREIPGLSVVDWLDA